LIKNNKNEATTRQFLSKSEYFCKIFENNKKTIKDCDTCLNETMINFNELSILFEENGIQKLNKNILSLCLKANNGKKKEEISHNILVLKNIFEKTKNIKVTNEEEVIKNMMLLSRKEDVYNVTISILLFIDKLGLKKKSLWEKCKEIITILDTSNKIDDIDYSILQLNYLGIKIDMLYNNENSKEKKYLNILLKLKEQSDSITFLLNKKTEECRYLQDLVEEMDDCFLNVHDILDLEKCIEFFKDLGNEETLKNRIDIDVLNFFKEKVNEHNNIELSFINYINNYLEIKSLSETEYYNSESSKYKIDLICKKSKFIFKNIKGELFKGEYYDDENIKSKPKEIKIDKLLELRDCAQLTKKVRNGIYELNNLENNRKFIKRISEIININEIINFYYLH